MRTRKMLLASVLTGLTVILCSCGPIVTAELPSVNRLKEDVTAYLYAMAGNEVLLYTLDVSQRAYDEKGGTLDYISTARFAWDEFGGENENQIAVHYALSGGGWGLESIVSDIDPASLDSRVVMRGLYTETMDLPAAVEAALAGRNTVMTGAPADFTVTLQGVAYRFPCCFTEFTLNGWEIAEASGLTVLSTIPANSSISLDMANGDDAVTLYVANRTGKAAYIGQGDCAGVIVRPQSAGATLAGEITGQSSAADVIAAYGAPDTDEETPDGRKLTYRAAGDSRVIFVAGAGGTQIDLFTLGKQAEQLPKAPLFDTYAFGFKLDGAAYALPARLDAFLNDGWEIAGGANESDVLRWYETKTLTLHKANASAEVTLRNPSMGDLRLYAASVTGITLDSSLASFALVNSNAAGWTELTPDQPAEAILAALGEPSQTETANGADVITYAADNGRYLRLTLGSGVTVAQLQAYAAENMASETLQAFALNITLGANTYTLPAAASEFQDRMWIPLSGWQQPVKAGSFVRMFMENRRAEGIVAYFVNTGKEIVALKDCTVGGLYAGPGETGMIVGRLLEKGIAISKVFDIFGMPAYDIQDAGARYLVYGTSIDRFLCVRIADGLADAMWIVCYANE